MAIKDIGDGFRQLGNGLDKISDSAEDTVVEALGGRRRQHHAPAGDRIASWVERSQHPKGLIV